MTSLRSQSDMKTASEAFVVWPPPRVSEVDPFDFGVATGADGPHGRGLNPYISRTIDGALDRTFRKHRAIVVSAPRGAGATRTAYEALNRTLPHALVLLPRKPGEFDSSGLLSEVFPATFR
jgi:hypothetical protein